MSAISSIPPDMRPGAATRPARPAPAAPASTKPAKPPKAAPGRGGGGGGGGMPGGGLSSGDRVLAKYLASLFGPTRTDAELHQMATGYVNDAIQPQLTNLANTAAGQLKTGSDALSKIYEEYAQRMGGIGDTVRSDNAAALKTEEASGGALRDYLAKEGGANAAGVAAAGSGEPAGSALANAAAEQGAGVAALGKGTAGEAAARGYTGLSELNAHGAAAQDFADKGPGLARLSGEQQLGSFAGQVQGNLKQQEDALLAQVPGMTTDLLQKLQSDSDAARQAKAQILSSFYGNTLDRNAQTAIAMAGLGKDMTVAQMQAAASKYGTDTRAAASAASTAERTRHDAALEQQAQASWGVSVERLRLAQQKADQARKSGGLTADGLARVQREAATDLQTYYNGVAARYQTGPGGQRVLVDGTGPGSQLQYFDAIKSLMLKYPALGPQKVIAMVNTLWKPGEGGRPDKQIKWGPLVKSGGPLGVKARQPLP